MARHKDVEWTLSDTPSWDAAKLATLMDIRDELKKSNSLQIEIRDGISAIRHFFHYIGSEKLHLLVKEHHRVAFLKYQRRRRSLTTARKRKAAKHGA